MNDLESNPVPEERVAPARGGAWSIVLLLFMLLLAVGAFGYGYYELSRVNLSLAQAVSTLRSQVESNQSSLVLMQQSMSQLRQGEEKTLAVTSQQEQMMNEWRAAQQGNKDKWQLAEAQSLVKMANDQLQFSANVPMAITLLQRADQTLQQSSAADAIALRKAIATDIASLQATPGIDTAGIYLKLTGLNNQIDKLVLPVNPLTQDNKKEVPVTKDYSKLSWWNATVAHSRDLLDKVVVVRNSNSAALPLVMPEERMFLYQNLHAQLENAMWAVLHHNTAVYQASIDRAIAWVTQYFAQDDNTTKNVLQQLQALRSETVEAPAKNVAATLQLFDQQEAPVAPAAPAAKTAAP